MDKTIFTFTEKIAITLKRKNYYQLKININNYKVL